MWPKWLANISKFLTGKTYSLCLDTKTQLALVKIFSRQFLGLSGVPPSKSQRVVFNMTNNSGERLTSIRVLKECLITCVNSTSQFISCHRATNSPWQLQIIFTDFFSHSFLVVLTMLQPGPINTCHRLVRVKGNWLCMWMETDSD